MNPAVEVLLNFYNKGGNMPKVTVSKSAQNQLIKIMSTKQNAKLKLNAGALREAAKITLESILELSPKAKVELAAALIKSV